MKRISLVVAVSPNGVIGRDGSLPWHISSDLKRFKQITMGKPVIMGRKTWESLPRKPLPGRQNIVVTRNRDYKAEGAETATSLDEALNLASPTEEICIIGGGELYAQALPKAHRIYLTEVDLEVAGDTHFPALNSSDWNETATEKHPRGEKDSAAFTLRTLDRILQG